MMDLLWGVGCVHVGGWVRAAWLSVCLLCGQAPAVTFESTSARPTIAASTTNALMTACVWKGCAATPNSTGTAGSRGGRGAAWSPRRPTATRDPSSMSSGSTGGASPPAWGRRAARRFGEAGRFV
uniref:Secreted protein n=1 Tax=Ursus americanus TaxID=9643 RepID=A0A452RY13_URSAM